MVIVEIPTQYKLFSRLGLLFVGFMVLWLGLPSYTRACSCSHQQIITWPSAQQLAPLNTRIWVKLPPHNQVLPVEQYRDFHPYPHLWAARFSSQQLQIALRLKGESAVVTSQQINLNLAEWRMSILYPQQNLLPEREYEIELRAGSLRAEIGKFKTLREADNREPPHPSIHNPRYIWDRPVHGACKSPEPYAVMDVGNSKQHESSFFGLWVAGSNGEINYNQAPNLVLQAQKAQILLGQTSVCEEKTFTFPPQLRQITLGIRAASLTGTWGPAQTISFPVGGILQPWSWSPNSRVMFWLLLGFLIFLLSVLRTWLFQNASSKLLAQFLVNCNALKNDMHWLELKGVFQRETSLRRKNLCVMLLQVALLALAFYVFWRMISYFSISPASLLEIYLITGTIAVFLLLNGFIHLLFFFTNKAKRYKISMLPASKIYEDARNELLRRWKKRGIV
jgi:hypothetical protein